MRALTGSTISAMLCTNHWRLLFRRRFSRHSRSLRREDIRGWSTAASRAHSSRCRVLLRFPTACAVDCAGEHPRIRLALHRGADALRSSSISRFALTSREVA